MRERAWGDLATAAEALPIGEIDETQNAAPDHGHRGIRSGPRAAGSSPGRSCWSAESRASANPRCCSKWPMRWRRPADGVQSPVRHQRRIRPPDRAAGRAAWASNRDQLLVLAETNVERILHQIAKHQAGRGGDRFDPDDLQAAASRRAGISHAASRLLHGSGLSGQGQRHRRHSRRACHQGRHTGRAQDHRAYRRYRRLFRG